MIQIVSWMVIKLEWNGSPLPGFTSGLFLSGMVNLNCWMQNGNEMKTEREKIVDIAQSYAPLVFHPDLSAVEIDAAIEELRTLRMYIHAIDYGSAPGYRKYEAIPERGKDDETEAD